jgi:hypothetical protein
MAHQQWAFDQDEQQQWHWTCIGENELPTKSPGTFETPVDCFIDAVRHAVRRRRAEAIEQDPVSSALDARTTA